MDIDKYLENLKSELDNKLTDIGNSNSYVDSISDNEYSAPVYCSECGTKIPSDANFCPNCGESINEVNSIAEEFYSKISPTDNKGNEGIIYTDTRILAEKYNCSCDTVISIIDKFREIHEYWNISWHFLDAANFREKVTGGTWQEYSDLIQYFCSIKKICTGPRLSLFIIGGNDVIPQPYENNPAYTPSPFGNDKYASKLYADLYYCFSGSIPLDFIDYNKARCNVGRLPLERGKVESTIEKDLEAYFSHSNMVTNNGGISIGRAIMTSNRDWIPASREMSRNLPTPKLSNTGDEVLDNMYISPSILAKMEDNLKLKYFNSLSEADMLLFNLHGTCEPKGSGFYSTDLAFTIDMLQETNAHIFNTVACWGARYINFKRQDSMLMNAIYGGDILLYSGACVPALGKCGNFQHDSTWLIQPAAYSESFMAKYSEYQCLGTMTAGEAFLKAKCDYYNSSRMIEEDELSLGTILMFNLYGNPMLKTKPDIHAISEIQNLDGTKMYRRPFRKMQKVECDVKDLIGNSTFNSIYEEVKQAVDNNLKSLHDNITKYLYEALNLDPRDLFCVEKYQISDFTGNQESGYLYNYEKKINNIQSYIRIKLDRNGQMIDAVQTK
jgi:hypothetical protein